MLFTLAGLLCLLLLARFFGVAAERFGQTAPVGELLAGVLLVAVTTFVATGGGADPAGLGWLAAKAAFFFAVTGLLGAHVYPHISERLQEEKVVALELSALLAVGLAYALFAEALGLHWIMGAFMAGLFFESERVGRRAYDEMQLILAAICSGVLGPLFFVTIGLRGDLVAAIQVPLLLVLVVAAAFHGKLAGAGLPALLLGFDRRHAAAVGIGMSARGAVELIILGVVAAAGVFAPGNGNGVAGSLFSVLVLMAVITTFATPLLLRWLLKRDG